MAAESIFGLMQELREALDSMETAPQTARVATGDGVQWFDDVDAPLPPGWSLSYRYTVDWEDGEPAVWILDGELNTGQQVVHLSADEIDQPRAQSLIAEDEVVQREARLEALR